MRFLENNALFLIEKIQNTSFLINTLSQQGNFSPLTLKIIGFLEGLPDFLIIMLVSMLPIIEIRGAIPVGIMFYQLHPLWVFFLALIGNLVPAFLLLLFLEKIDQYLRKRSQKFARFFDWLYLRTRKKGEKKYQKWGEWALAIFVGIPLPFTGTWTGAVLAVIFKIPFKRAIAFIGMGLIISGIIVTLITLTANGMLR